MNGFFERWNRYWFSGQAPVSLAVARVAVGISALMSYYRFRIDFDAFLRINPDSLYTPRGLLRLLPNQPPAFLAVQAWEAVGLLALVLFLFNVRARLTGTVALVCHLLLVSLTYSFMPGWTHGYNMVYMVWLAIVWGPHESYSRLTQPPPSDRATRWPLLLAQAILSLCFFGAAMWKIRSDLSFAWVWSDSLRYHLFTRYPYMGESTPPFVAWILEEAWRYRGVALLNMLAQTLPMIAVLFSRSPTTRAIGGLVYIAEVFGLGLVMGLMNWHWLPLAVVYFDWDALYARITGSRVAATASRLNLRPRYAVSFFLAGVLGLHAAVVLTDPTLSKKLNAYPFTNYRLYVEVRAKPSLAEHRDYEWLGARFATNRLSPDEQRIADRHTTRAMRRMQYLHLEVNAQQLAGNTEAFANQLIHKGLKPKVVTLRKDVEHADKFPSPTTLETVYTGLSAVWENGESRALSAKRFWGPNGEDCLMVDAQGELKSIIDMKTSSTLLGEPLRPSGIWKGRSFCFDQPQGETVLAYLRVRFAGAPEEVYLAAPLRRPAQSFLSRVWDWWNRSVAS